MKELGVLLIPLDRMLVHCVVTPSNVVKFTGINLGGKRQCGVRVLGSRVQDLTSDSNSRILLTRVTERSG